MKLSKHALDTMHQSNPKHPDYRGEKCRCLCHTDKRVKHIAPCCDNGYIKLMSDEEMRSQTIAKIGEQILKSNKEHGCKG